MDRENRKRCFCVWPSAAPPGSSVGPQRALSRSPWILSVAFRVSSGTSLITRCIGAMLGPSRESSSPETTNRKCDSDSRCMFSDMTTGRDVISDLLRSCGRRSAGRAGRACGAAIESHRGAAEECDRLYETAGLPPDTHTHTHTQSQITAE